MSSASAAAGDTYVVGVEPSRGPIGTDRVILTGGLAAHQWATAIPGVDAIDPLLTLRGLAILHDELARTGSAAPA